MARIPEIIIIRSLRGTTTPEEEGVLDAWLREDKRNAEIFCQMEEIWSSRESLPEEEVRSGWNRIVKESAGTVRHSVPIHAARRLSWLRYAAAVVIGVAAASAVWLGVNVAVEPEQTVIINNAVYNHDGVQQITLPDGSRVWLNGDSKITYPETFAPETRLVSLEGKAYFEVAPDKAHPFVVCSEGANVRVTGTEFVFESQSGEDAFVTLISGRVEVGYGVEADGMTAVSLLPGQQAYLPREGGAIGVSDVDTEYYVIWKDGTYRFTEEPLENIASHFGRYYNLDIRVSPAISKKKFTGRITSGDTVEDVLRVINASYPIKYKLTGSSLSISER